MQIFINVKLDTDCRWRRVIDGQLKDKIPHLGSDINFFDIEDCAVAYLRGENGSHIFMCTKKMERIVGSIRPKLLAILNDDELCFSGRIIKQLRLPSWFADLEEDSDRRRTIINELSDFSKWVNNKHDDPWVAPEFSMSLLAQIVDKLLTAVSKNESAKIVLACDQQNLKRAQKLLYYALRCLPVKISNKLTFNTAAKEMTSVDICCGNFSDAEVKEGGGVRIDIGKALSAQSDATESEHLHNAYAYYIRMLNVDEDPCDGFDDKDEVDALNAAVNNKVLEVKGNRLVEKCKTGNFTVEELNDFADSAKDSYELVKKQLQKIADYLCLNYTGFTNCYLRLTDEYQSFYSSFVTDKGRCPNWGSVEKTDSLIKYDEKCNREYIKILYEFWCGEKRNTVYKKNKIIEQFLFLDYDKRFQINSSLYKAFQAYWDSLNEDDFLEYLSHGTAWGAEAVSDYIIIRNSETIIQLVKYCCELKAEKGIGSEIVSRICNKYLSGLFERKIESSVHDLQLVQKMATENGIVLDTSVSNAIQAKVDNERDQHRDKVIEFLSSNSQIEGIEKTKKRDKSVAEKRQKKNASGINLDDEVVVYNIARLSERDCGEAGTIHNADWSGKLRVFSACVGILFVLQMIALGLADSLLLNKLYIFGCRFWIEVGLTGLIFLIGSFVWCHFEIKIYSLGKCDNKQYESRSATMLKWLFVLCGVATIIKVALAILFIVL